MNNDCGEQPFQAESGNGRSRGGTKTENPELTGTQGRRKLGHGMFKGNREKDPQEERGKTAQKKKWEGH